MKYKALLLDVDGTLVPVGPNTLPSERVAESLKRARESAHVSLASGRCLDWLVDIFTALELEDPCIINGGSQIINPKTREILWERPISQEAAKAIFQIIARDSIPFIVSDDGLEYENPLNREFAKPLAIKLTYFDSKERSDQCLQMLSSIPGISAHKTFSWDKNRNYKMEIYITHHEATKHHAALELARLLGITAKEMIGVGDARNDTPLLNVCGLRIAMGNADDKLKRVAHYIAPSVEEDGVAHVVEHFIFKKETGRLIPNRRPVPDLFNKLVNLFGDH